VAQLAGFGTVVRVTCLDCQIWSVLKRRASASVTNSTNAYDRSKKMVIFFTPNRLMQAQISGS
jgi:hypothetical protein